MRFLNIILRIPHRDIETNISFINGQNIIQTDTPYLQKILPQIPFISLFGKGNRGEDPGEIIEEPEFYIQLETEQSGRNEIYSCSNEFFKHSETSFTGNLTLDDFFLYSYVPAEYSGSEVDPSLTGSSLKKFLINRDSDDERNNNVHRLEEIISQKEKELNLLNKNKQILELKKRKKDKLIKELSVSEKDLGRLQSKINSYKAYQNTLTGLLELANEDVKLSSKIVTIKKDINEMREIREKCDNLQNEINLQFPQFTGSTIDLIPDLDSLQEEFNSFRDINELIGKFDSTRRRKISVSLKLLTGMLLFTFISVIFIFIKSIPLSSITGIVLGTLSSLLVLFSIATGYQIFVLTHKRYPDELLNRKKAIESRLMEVFKSENFPEKNFGTGELYEYLFQYFEDFLSLRELRKELSEIKKKINPQCTMGSKEQKLKSLTEKKEIIEKDIQVLLNSLDANIHSIPEIDDIPFLIPEIDEMITEIEKEAAIKKSISEKIEKEKELYESGNNSASSIDASIAEIDFRMKKLDKDIQDIHIMKKVYDETSGVWFQKKLTEISEKSAGIFALLISTPDRVEKISRSVQNLITTGTHENFTPEEIILLSISVKIALSGISEASFNLPLILDNPFASFSSEIADKLKKILLELSDKRQVVIITSKSETYLAGNLINI